MSELLVNQNSRVLLAELITVDLIGETSAGRTPNSSMTVPMAFFLSNHLGGGNKSRRVHVRLFSTAWRLDLPYYGLEYS